LPESRTVALQLYIPYSVDLEKIGFRDRALSAHFHQAGITENDVGRDTLLLYHPTGDIHKTPINDPQRQGAL